MGLGSARLAEVPRWAFARGHRAAGAPWHEGTQGSSKPRCCLTGLLGLEGREVAAPTSCLVVLWARSAADRLTIQAARSARAGLIVQAARSALRLRRAGLVKRWQADRRARRYSRSAVMLERRYLRCLTFELTGPRRRDGLARAGRMYRVPQAGPSQPAVGGPVVQRGVRRHVFWPRILTADLCSRDASAETLSSADC